METIYLSLVPTGSWGTFFMKYPVEELVRGLKVWTSLDKEDEQDEVGSVGAQWRGW